MARRARSEGGSSSGIYHVTCRGAGRRDIFEDEQDMMYYLERLAVLAPDCGIIVLAWCLMGNHVHLLVEGDASDLTRLMRRLNTSHSRRFNGRHGHVGPVFQGRYRATAVESDGHLLDALIYIHRNPEAAGVSSMDSWRWSSYGEYFGHPDPELPRLCDRSRIELMGVDLLEAHGFQGEIEMIDPSQGRRALSDIEVRERAASLFGPEPGGAIARMAKPQRDDALRRLSGMGASVRQIERLTGIGRNTVHRATRTVPGDL